MKFVAALLLAAAGLAATPAHAMDFRRIGSTLVLSGPVVSSDLVRWRDHFAEPGGIKLVLLHESPGGDLFTGYQIANRIRDEGLSTAVAGKCESACGLIFLGGVQRSFSDGAPLATTTVSLHGAHHGETRQLLPELSARMAWVIRNYTAWKFPPDLLERTVYPHDPGDAMFAFHPAKYGQDGAAKGVVECLRQPDKRFKCTMVPGLDAMAIGVATSAEVLALDPEVKQFLAPRD